ncbi:helix-turn-helix domain-containing protein [Streptomyces koyangensis]|uniref:helix-turn-helix domain-containing protein n=1 Tax=Streptomyces koyangensis TaxID=188770 RepID=UPI003451D5E4
MIPDLYRACENMLATTPRDGQRVSGTRSFGIKLNAVALEARDTLRARLRAWCDLVNAEHECVPAGLSMEGLAEFLHQHARWLCHHPAAGDAISEMAETATMARRVVSPERVRRFRVGACIEHECGGSLIAVIQADGRLPSEVRCDNDPGHAWSAYEWRELDRRVSDRQQTGRPWLTAKDVAELCRISMSNVYRLASENGWRRRTNGRRVYYAKADVLASVG